MIKIYNKIYFQFPNPKYKSLLRKLKIDETLSKRIKSKPAEGYNHIKDNIPLISNYNYMADTLCLPTAKFGYKYLFVMVDLKTTLYQLRTKNQ